MEARGFWDCELFAYFMKDYGLFDVKKRIVHYLDWILGIKDTNFY